MPENCAAIVIAAKHHELTKVKDARGTTNTIGALRCKFQFRTDDWLHSAKTAMFCNGDAVLHPEVIDDAIAVPLDSDNECPVPYEVLKDTQPYSIGIWGATDNGLRIVSNWLVFRAQTGCYTEGNAPAEPERTVYEEILLISKEATDAAQDVTNRANSGEFDGKSAYELAQEEGFEGTLEEWIDSLVGAPGYTPVKGVDYFDGANGKDGYTPVKGVDYFDGVDGNDGYTPVKGVDYFDGKNGKDGYTPIKGVDYFDGQPGKDGKDGADGKDGKDGYSPVKGVDYFDGKDGANGKDGYTPVKGVDYFDGKDGADAVSPTVAVEAVEGGHRVTITDVGGNKTFDILNGSDATSPSSIIDVLELPTENIDETAFYRLVTVKFVFNGDMYPFGRIKCVDALPEIGDPFLNLNTGMENVYYNVTDGKLYGYVDEGTATQADVAIGWHEASYIYDFIPYTYGGIITDINDCPHDSSDCFLLRYEWYTYKNGWTRCVFAHEKPTIVDVYWDGETAGHEMFKMGENKYFVKVDDVVPTKEDLIGGTYCLNVGIGYYIAEDSCDDSLAGAIKVGDYILVINSAEDFMGASTYSEGTPSNGLWFAYNAKNNLKVVNCVGLPKISQIPGEYLGVPDLAATKEGLKDAVAVNGGVYYPTDDLSYSLRDDYASYYVTNAKRCTDKHIVVPAKYKGYPVVEIVSSAFSNKTTLESVTLHEYINEIWGSAFSGCTALRHVYLYSKTPVTLGASAFPTTVKKFFVPKDSVAAYKANSTWSSYKDKIFPMETMEDLTDEVNELKAALEALTTNVATARIGEVTLLASAWVGEGNLYSQVVNIDGVTENSQVDLTPDIHQLAVFYEKDLAFVTENEGGVVTVYVIGQKPANDYTIQVTITEVVV